MTTARRDRRIALIAGGLLALLFTLCAAARVADWTTGSVERTAHQVVPGPVRELRVEAGSGDITLVPAADGDVTIDSRASGTLRAPHVRARVEPGAVHIDGGCPALAFGRCETELVIRVPAGTAVRVDAASGDVTASDLAGGADLRTSSGDVVARDLRGTLSLESRSGDIDASGLLAPVVRAHTGSGDVELFFAAAPRAVEAETASGDARIVVPHGSEKYRVDAETGSGERDVDVDDDPDATRLLRAHTRSGDATLEYAGG